MQINMEVKPNLRFRAFYLIFILYSAQTGVGVMGLPRYIFKEAHRDSWISILIAYVFMIILLYVMFLILKQYESADIFGIQVDVFGRFFGTILGSFYIVYSIAGVASVLLNYIEVLKVFLHPVLPAFVAAFFFLILIGYTVLGGIRIVIGVTFIFILCMQWVYIFMYDPISKMDLYHFLPMFQTSIPDLLRGAKATSFSLSGLELLLIIYPFIENKEKAKLPAFLGITYTTFVILFTTVMSIGYFSPQDIEEVDWSVLSLFKSLSYSFLERLDYIVIGMWIFIVIPNMCLHLWAATYGIKRLFKVRQKVALYGVMCVLYVLIFFVNTNMRINLLTDTVAKVSIWLVFVYPFILLPLVLLKKKWRKAKGSAPE